MSESRRTRRITVIVLALLLLAAAVFAMVTLAKKPAVINVEADLNQPSTAVPAAVIHQALADGGFRGTVYDTADYDLIAEKVQDTADSRDITVGVTARPLDTTLYPDIVSLGTVSEVPLIIATRDESTAVTTPTDLLGKRIQIGLIGSVANDLGRRVLEQYGVTEQNSTFLEDKADVATKSVLDGKSDAMIALYSPGDTGFDAIVEPGRLRLIPTTSTRAVAGHVGYVVAGTLPRGAFSVKANIPPVDIPVIKVPITVIAHSGISRAAAFEIAAALNNRFSQGTVLADPGTFPSFTHTLPSDPAAVEFYASGAIPWQYRTLPAAIADMFIPLALFSSILLIVISVYQLLLPDALHLWTGVLRPRRQDKRSRKTRG